MKEKTYKEKYKDSIWQRDELARSLVQLEAKWTNLRIALINLLKDDFEPKHADED